jgi:Uncharacterized protein conserved in bacteria (DUF2330)
MRRCLAVLVTATAATFIGAPAALACGGLVAPNGAVKLVNTTTLVAYHDGVEHYVTSFEYAGGGTRFGSIIPLPGVPTSVTRGGSWTLQRLELEVHPPAPETFSGGAKAASAAAAPAQVILRTQVDALTITVVKGGGPAVTAWVRQQGFTVSPDLPAMLNFYAERSPIFLTATFNPAAEAARGLHLGDGTPIDVAIPLSNPWVPLHILSLAKDSDDVVQADVFMLTDRQPALVSGPGIQLRVSRPAEPSLLNDLRSDRGMAWIPSSAWLSYLSLDTPASSLTYDLAADVSGNGHPSLTAAALVPVVNLRIPTTSQSDSWAIAGLTGIGFVVLLLGVIGYHHNRRMSARAASSP